MDGRCALRLKQVIAEARACTLCASGLPLGPRPLVRGNERSRIVIIGQAPGRAAHESGVPWNDRSGDRLRGWLGLSREAFDDERLVALVPMGFCYPGTGRSGDAPPRPECAPLWHPRIFDGLRSVELAVVVGRHAFERYLGAEFGSVTEAVRAHRRLLPGRVALPHPSPRNNSWLRKHAWFEREALPAVRERVEAIVRSARA